MSQFQRNILANFIGKGWPAFIGLACVPLYIRFMGIEAYGLVGFYAALQSVFTLLDMGLSTTLNREIARLSAQTGTEQEARNLVKTLELIYWAVAGVIMLIVLALAPVLSTHWIRAEHLSASTVRHAVLMMGIATACQFPAALYAGGLLGLQRQVLLNGLTVVIVTLRGIGAVVLLWLVSPTIEAFFAWQMGMNLALTLASGWCLWRGLPPTSLPARFHRTILRGIWRFAAGMSGISVLAVLLTQLDKILLSKFLTLKMFGYYSLATVVSSGLYLLASPVYTAVFPRFSQLVSQHDDARVTRLYHQSCQLVSLVVLPVALTIAAFSQELLLAWTRNASTASQTHLLVTLLVIGTALNTLAITPQALQLAYGWTSLAFYENVVAVLLLVPLIIVMTIHYGAIGAAIVWIVLNSGYVVVGLAIMHRRLLKGELWPWYAVDVALPLGGALLAVGIGRLAFPGSGSSFFIVWWLAMVFMGAVAAACCLTPVSRQWFRQYLLRGSRPVVSEGAVP